MNGTCHNLKSLILLHVTVILCPLCSGYLEIEDKHGENTERRESGNKLSWEGGDAGEKTSPNSFPLPIPVLRELARLRFLETNPPLNYPWVFRLNVSLGEGWVDIYPESYTDATTTSAGINRHIKVVFTNISHEQVSWKTSFTFHSQLQTTFSFLRRIKSNCFSKRGNETHTASMFPTQN